MQILLPPDIIERLIHALEQADTREIGGILMGEHIAENVFRVKDLTVQQHSGSFVTFVRMLQDIIAPLRHFFQATNHNYSRFNYLGEWHSHPSFVPEPSSRDRQTMRDLIEDPAVGAHFVVLMIVKLTQAGQLDGSVTVFQPAGLEARGELVLEREYGKV
jgi:[CysO sulfur-carrier protein]-S-L-cysteine hydrolase